MAQVERRTVIRASPGAPASFRWADGRTRRAVVETVWAERLLSLRWLPFERTAAGEARPIPSTRIQFILAQHPDGTVLEVREGPVDEVAMGTGAAAVGVR